MRVTFASMGTGEVASFGIMYVSSALRRAGHDVRLIETQTQSDLIERLRRDPTDLVAFSVTTGLHRIYLRWARAVKTQLGLATLVG